MSELTHLLSAVWLRFRLATRVVVSAAILFAGLTLSRMHFDPGPPTFLGGGSVRYENQAHGAMLLVHAPIIVLYMMVANAIFRSVGRKTLVDSLGTWGVGIALGLMSWLAFGGSIAIHVYGYEANRTTVIASVVTLANMPFLAWVVFNAGVAEVSKQIAQRAQDERRRRREADAQRRRQRQREAAMRIDNRIARLRKAFEQKRRHLDSLPIEPEEREHLKELSEADFRDRIHDLLAEKDDSDTSVDHLFDGE